MKSHRVFGLNLIGAAVAMFLFVAIAGSHVSAANSTDLRTSLLASGYQVVPSLSTPYAGMSMQPQAYTVHNGDAHAQVELFEYASEAALQQDWLVAAGAPATPKKTMDLSGRSAYWNANSVLVVDFRGFNDPALALSVGQVFLSQTGSEPLAPAVSSRMAAETTGTSVVPPHTGDANLLAQGQHALPLWAGLLWAGLSIAAVVSAGAGGLVLLRNVHR